MEALIFSIGFCIAGVLIGWELKNVIQKFKDDRKGMLLRQLREDVKERARSDALKGIAPNKLKDPIIVEAEKIINDHLAKKNVLKSIKDNNQEDRPWTLDGLN